MTLFGLYSSSKYLISSSVNSTLRAARMTIPSAAYAREGGSVLTDHLLEVFRLSSADDGGSDLRHGPGQCNLRHTNLLLFGEFTDPGVTLGEQLWSVTIWATYRLTMVSVALLDLYMLAQLITRSANSACNGKEATTYGSVSDRFVVSFQERVSRPLARGLQGIQATPRC